jgi:hypothetical protein
MAAIEHNNGRNIGAKLMAIGLGTYAFFWQWHDTAENPLALPSMIDRTADLGVSLFQVCDYPLLESYEPDDLIAPITRAAAVCSWNSAPAASGPRSSAVISRARAGSRPACGPC